MSLIIKLGSKSTAYVAGADDRDSVSLCLESGGEKKHHDSNSHALSLLECIDPAAL
jgi:hypothetical protein